MRIRCLLLVLASTAATLTAQDLLSPTIERRSPAANTMVRTLTDVEVLFSEEVNGIDPGDLLLNGVAATNVFGAVPGQYVWQFASPATGVVSIAFSSGHGITDLSGNPFAGGSWFVTLNPNAPVYGVVISEILAENQNGIHDEDGDSSDWIELYNGGDEVVNLGGWFLSDEALNLAKWRLPAVDLAPASYLLVWATEKDRTNNVLALHANFRLERSGEFLALSDPSTNVVSAFNPFPTQTADVSYGRDRTDPNLVAFYATPTPRNHNTNSGAGVLPNVEFSRASSTFVTPFQLALSVANTNAEIRYLVVTNRMSATNLNFLSITNLKLYSGPITIDSSWQVRARAFPKAGANYFPSDFQTESYIQLNPNVLDFNSDLPLVIIHDFGAGPYDQSATQREETSVIAIFEPGTDRSSLTNHPVLVSRAGINARGSSTLGYAKVSLAVELWSEFNDDADKPVLGMKEESDWVFYAPNNFEPVLFHNPLYYQLSRDVGRWAPYTKYAEVFLNTSTNAVATNHYNGIYVVTEKIKRSPSRLDIPRLDLEDTNSPAITGGYLLSIDRVDTGETTFTTTGFGAAPVLIQPYSLIYVDPGSRNGMNSTVAGARDPQERYIANYINTMITNLASPTWTNYPKIYDQHIDADSWIDHIHIAMAAFNVDAVRLSGFLFKDRNKRIEFGPAWDCDRCMGSTDGRELQPRTWTGSGDRSDFFNPSGSLPNFWFQRLFRDIDFWQKYVDRYQELRAGPFHLTNINARIDQNVEELISAYPREFNRWRQNPRRFTENANGTYAITTTGASYDTEVAWKKEWFRARFNFLDTNHLDRPLLSSTGGSVTNGTTVLVSPAVKAGSWVVYTLDGTDPRAPHGRIAPGALSNLGPVSLVITGNVRVVARSLNGAHSNLTGTDRPPLTTPWSGPVAATFYTTVPPLRITEIMYHPLEAAPGNTNDQDNFEYVEVRNIGEAPLNVNRFRLRGGVDFDFPNEVLAAGEHAVIVRNLASFRERYGAGPRVLGEYVNDFLDNAADRLVLEGGVREPILDFGYEDGWYPTTDGFGFSLQIVNDSAPTSSWGVKSSWRPSGVLGGTPSAADPGPPGVATIYVNEVLTHTDPLPADAIELFNPTGGAVDLGGWFLTDDFDNPKKFRIPDGTSIGANSYLVFYQSNSFGAGTNGFALSSHGDETYVFSADAAGNLTGWAHGYDFGPQADGVTFGRYLTSLGLDRFVAQASPTLGAANAGPKVGPIVISEIHYHPPDLQAPHELLDNERDEYIELQNLGGTVAPLYDPANPNNTWRLRDAVDFRFPVGATVPANGYVLVVSFNPANLASLAAFRQANGVPLDTPVYGPWSGKLDNSQDSVELVRPDLPDPDTGVISFILVERVNYQDTLPWPVGLVDGLGAALGRIDPSAYGDDATNWRTAPRTPGAPLPAGGTAPTIVTEPVNTSGIEGQSASFELSATGSALGYIWTFNGKVIASAPSAPVLNLSPLVLDPRRPGGPGVYACYVFNSAGSEASANATLVVRQLPRVTLHPTNRAVWIKPDSRAVNTPDGTNVIFAAGASTVEPPILYQWRFNGTNIPGATSSTLVVTNVQVEDEGDYYCFITDGVSSVSTFSAHLTPLIQPIIVQPPLAQTIVEGSDFAQSVEIIGHPAPFGYSWRRALPSATLVSNYVSARSNFIVLNSTAAGLVLPNGVTSSNYELRVVVFNEANLTPGVLVRFTNTVVADFDRDGVPDTVENALGLAPNDPADGALDLDGDGMSNRAEYVAGTDLASSASYLKITSITAGGGATLTFGAVSNKTYTIQYTDQLGSGAWTRLKDVFARTTNRTETVFDPVFTTNRSYRVATPFVP